MGNCDHRVRVLVAHPNQQHAMRLAEALNKAGILEKYATTIYIKEKSICGSILKKVNVPFVKRLLVTCNQNISDHVITRAQFYGFCFYLVSKLDKNKRICYGIYDIMTRRFGKQIARYIDKETPDILVMFDFTAVPCWERLENRNVIKVLDMSSVPAVQILKIIDEEQCKGRKEDYQLLGRRYTEKRCRYYNREIEMADYFLVASEYAERVIMNMGISKSRIYKVPYGLDAGHFKRYGKNVVIDGKVIFIFVGRLEGTKGFYYMMEAIKKVWKVRQDFELVLVGDACGNEKHLNEYRPGIQFEGRRSSADLIQLYNQSNVCISPSLWEGFSFSLLEAMSCGLPVIATDRSAALDIVQDGEEGFVVQAGDSNQIADKIVWFLDHKEEISSMGEKASLATKKYSWENYSRGVVTAMFDIYEKGREGND